MNFIYKVIKGDDVINHGEPIQVEKQYIHHIAPSNYNFVKLNNITVNKYVFLTACSSNHFLESLDCIGSIQKHFPGYSIVYYDLGLSESQAQKVSFGISTIYIDFTLNLIELF